MRRQAVEKEDGGLSLRLRALPIGLAHNVRLTRAVARDQVVSVDDVSLDSNLDVVALRREMETGPGDSFH